MNDGFSASSDNSFANTVYADIQDLRLCQGYDLDQFLFELSLQPWIALGGTYSRLILTAVSTQRPKSSDEVVHK